MKHYIKPQITLLETETEALLGASVENGILDPENSLSKGHGFSSWDEWEDEDNPTPRNKSIWDD